MTEMEHSTLAEDEATPVDAGLVMSRKVFALRLGDACPGADAALLKTELLASLETNACADLYVKYCDEFGWMLEDDKLAAMRAKNDAELKQLDERIADAEVNQGDSEVREALLAKAEFFARIGKREEAVAALKATEEKTVAVGQKMDLMFSLLRLDLIHSDYTAVKANLAKARKLFEEGGDWERKNRLKVYEALFYMCIRDFNKAAELFLASIATFTCYELFSYQTFIFYTCVTCVVALDRVTLKSKVVDAPEILTVIGQMPHVAKFVNSLHECDYGSFFAAFCPLADDVAADIYLHPHFRYFMRQVRVVAYSQFLESYKSVTLESMALSFGVGAPFLDAELSAFIAAGRLNCKVDKVAGVVETNRPDAKNALYQTVIKQGDLLLNRVQKLSKVIDL